MANYSLLLIIKIILVFIINVQNYVPCRGMASSYPYSYNTTGRPYNEEITTPIAVNKSLMPFDTYCGFQYFDNRFDNTNPSKEFPWLVDVLSNKNNYKRYYKDRCSGVLINNRYVLTSKNCGIYADRVRLGAYSNSWKFDQDRGNDRSRVLNDNLNMGLGYSDTSKYVDIEELIQYNSGSSTSGNIIALLRLSNSIVYSDFIRPICLKDKYLKFMYENEMQITGWKSGDRGYSGTLERQKISFYVTENESCYNKLKAEVTFNASLICMIPKSGDGYVCGEDRGSPVMYQYKHQWYLQGIVNSVYTSDYEWCVKNGFIDVIKITPEIIEWILKNIRPV